MIPHPGPKSSMILGVADQVPQRDLGLLGDDSIPEGPQSVQSMGNPISISTNRGFTTRFLERGAGPKIASVNVVPECRPELVEYPAAPLDFASLAVGVGQDEYPSSAGAITNGNFDRSRPVTNLAQSCSHSCNVKAG